MDLEKIEGFGEDRGIWRRSKDLEKIEGFGEDRGIWTKSSELEKLCGIWRSYVGFGEVMWDLEKL